MTRFSQGNNKLRRRTVLKTASAFPLIGAGITGGSQTVAATGESTFVIEQGDKQIPVTPLSYEDQSIEDVYYYRPSTQTKVIGIEKSNTTRLFLYEGPQGISLVILHDEPSDGSGGSVRFEFENLPPEGSWVVTNDTPPSPSDTLTDTSYDWNFNGSKTDGGAYRGDFEGQSSPVTISPNFRSGIDSWEVLSGDPEDPTVTELDLNEPITITSGQSLQSLADEKLALADRIDENSLGFTSDRKRVAPVLSRLTETASTGSLSRSTASDAIRRLKYGEQVTDTVLAGAGPGPGNSPLLESDESISRLTAKSAVNPILELFFAGLALLGLARRIPTVGRYADEAADRIFTAAADIAGTFSPSLERIIRSRGEAVGADILEELTNLAAELGKEPTEEQFAEIRAAKATPLIEDSSEVIFRDYLFREEYNNEEMASEPVDESLSKFIEQFDVDPDSDPDISGNTAEAQTVSEDSINDINNNYSDAADLLNRNLSIIQGAEKISLFLAIVAAIAATAGAGPIAGLALGAGTGLLGLGIAAPGRAMNWGIGVKTLLGARFRHQNTLPAIRHPSGGS